MVFETPIKSPYEIHEYVPKHNSIYAPIGTTIEVNCVFHKLTNVSISMDHSLKTSELGKFTITAGKSMQDVILLYMDNFIFN
jgi:hypothetical protein